VYPYDAGGRMPGTSDVPIPSPLVWLAFVAARTEALRLATGVSLLPERHPLVFAKEVATLDSLSGGRVVLGIGIGWLREEFEALGVPWERRGARTEEYMEVMRRVWTEDVASFDGEFVSFTDVASSPRPVRRNVPIHIGGHSDAAARRAGRVGEGFFPAAGNIPELIDIARQTAADAGRDPSGLEVTTVHPGLSSDDPGAAVEELEAWGADRALLPAFRFFRDTEERLSRAGEALVAAHP
jgi:probable F420-dependent oxidoreductase